MEETEIRALLKEAAIEPPEEAIKFLVNERIDRVGLQQYIQGWKAGKSDGFVAGYDEGKCAGEKGMNL